MRLLTAARDLSRRKARERDGRFVVEGMRAVEELLASPIRVLGVLCGPQLLDSERGAALRARLGEGGVEVSDVSEREFAGAASTESPQGILAIGEIPTRSLGALDSRTALRVLVLDGVQDPGNAGTMIRTAHALGADATIGLPGTVDVWNAKVVRSAMGSLFRHHVQHADFEEFRSFVQDRHVECWGADVRGEPVHALAVPARLALVVGNEGAGLSSTVGDLVTQRVSLPMRGDAESLNVAVAAGILLHAVMQ